VGNKMTKKELKQEVLNQIERFQQISDTMTKRSKENGVNIDYTVEYFNMISGVLHFASINNIISYTEFTELVTALVDWKYQTR
jgi:hypothetical protein